MKPEVTTQEQSEKYFNDWLMNGRFTKNGLTYKRGVNDDTAIKALIPSDLKMIGKICHISSELTLTNTDLDENYHKGFTVGNGKTFYWMMLWHKSGHVTVFTKSGDFLSSRWLNGDTIITVHFKPTPQ